MMQETERKQCDSPGCSSAVYVTVMEHGASKAEKLCLAHPAHESTPYVAIGRALFEERFAEFRYLGRGRWLLPSATTPERHYEVSTRGEGSCECLGWWHHRHCCHQVAADLTRLKSFSCDSCGERFLNREMVEVQEEHLDWTLAFFLGEKVCRECAGDHGLL